MQTDLSGVAPPVFTPSTPVFCVYLSNLLAMLSVLLLSVLERIPGSPEDEKSAEPGMLPKPVEGLGSARFRWEVAQEALSSLSVLRALVFCLAIIRP